MAFYRGPQPIEAGFLRDRLGASLPWYMVPAAFHWRESLPLTANSKIDTKALTALAGELGADSGADYDAPRTPAEQRLAAAWAAVLGLSPDGISRRDNFFDRGGSSLLAVKLAIALDRTVSLKDLTRYPVLADMAGLIDGKSRAGDTSRPRKGTSADRAAPAAAGGGRRAGPGVLPLRRRQRGELPGDGRPAAGQRAGRLRRRAARP